MKVARIKGSELMLKDEIVEREPMFETYIEFDGTRVSVPFHESYDIREAITIVFEGRIELDPDNTSYLQFMVNNAFSWHMGIRQTDGFATWYSKKSGGNTNWLIGRTFEEKLNKNEWFQAVYTYDVNAQNPNTKFYLDGKLISSRIYEGEFIENTQGFNIIASSYIGGFKRAMLYNRALSKSEVSELFNGSIPMSGLIGNWGADNVESGVLLDASFVGNHADLTGGAVKEHEVILDDDCIRLKDGNLYVGELVETDNKENIKKQGNSIYVNELLEGVDL